MSRIPGLLKRGDVWYIRYYAPGPDGTRREVMRACRGMNQRQAEQYRRQILISIYHGEFSQPTTQTVAEYLTSWLERMKTQVAATTWDAYRKYVTRHVIPHIGVIGLCELVPLTVQELYAKLLRQGRRDGEGLSPKSVRNLHGILHSAFAQAVRLQLLRTNPLQAVDSPRCSNREVHTIGAPEIKELLTRLEGTRYYLPVVIALGTGMRRGEVLGLRWEDVDAERGALTVRRALVQVPGSVNTKEPKTGNSRRIPIPAVLVSLLVEHRQPTGWVCDDGRGRPITPQALSTAFRRYRGDISITLQGLRHTQATTLLMAGVPVKVVSERLGHSTSRLTEDTYGHVLPHIQDQAVLVVDAFLAPHVRAQNEQNPSE